MTAPLFHRALSSLHPRGLRWATVVAVLFATIVQFLVSDARAADAAREAEAIALVRTLVAARTSADHARAASLFHPDFLALTKDTLVNEATKPPRGRTTETVLKSYGVASLAELTQLSPQEATARYFAHIDRLTNPSGTPPNPGVLRIVGVIEEEQTWYVVAYYAQSDTSEATPAATVTMLRPYGDRLRIMPNGNPEGMRQVAAPR